MRQIPRKPINKPACGFTLIELLVVLVILMLASAMLAPQLFGMLKPDPMRDIPEYLQDKIDRMRSDAIFKAHQELAVIDYLDNKLTINGEVWSPPAGWQFVPQDLPLEDTHAASPSQTGEQATDRIELLFAPDGTAKSAHFSVQGPDGRQGWNFDISAFTGRLTIRPLGEETNDHAAS